MKIAYIHHLKISNIGDIMSAPYFYFKFSDQKDGRLFDLYSVFPDIEYDVAVFGGGAIAGNMAVYGVHQRIRARYKIGWGIGRTIRGITRRSKTPHPYPNDLALLGIRDWFKSMPRGADWVPCSSCMHPGFDKSYEATREAVGFFNGHMPIPQTGLHHMTNRSGKIEKVLDFLGSAETVVTNSYHGAYWAALLGRKVAIVGAYSSKFFDYKWRIKVTDVSGWRQAKLASFPEALPEARLANQLFYEKVMGLING